jgi:hypothetical protein
MTNYEINALIIKALRPDGITASTEQWERDVADWMTAAGTDLDDDEIDRLVNAIGDHANVLMLDLDEVEFDDQCCLVGDWVTAIEDELYSR